MASPLDLQEQEQVDALKAFWQQYGNLITWGLVAALLVYAGITGWQWWQRDQSAHAGAMFDEFERALGAGDVDRAASRRPTSANPTSRVGMARRLAKRTTISAGSHARRHAKPAGECSSE